MFHFIWPSMLGLIPIAIALAVVRVYLRRYRREQLLRAWGHERNRQRFAVPQARWPVLLKDWLTTIGLCAAAVAMARPSLQSSTIEFPENNARVVGIIDDSLSMAARDSGDPSAPRTRLKTALEAMRDKVIPACRGNLFGLITYAGQAYPQTLPTRQLDTALHFLNTIGISDAPGEGSNVNGAFELAWRYFDELEKSAGQDATSKPKKVIVFWSDGGTDDKFDVNAIIAGCNERGIQVLVFGVGDLKPVRIPVAELPRQNRNLARGSFLEIQGQVVETTLQEEPLMLLQEGTAVFGSRYQRVKTSDDVQLERLVTGVEMVRRTGERELFRYPTALFLACLLTVPLLKRVRQSARKKEHR